MFWSFVAVHLLVITVISNDSFPIDLKEIDPEDIYLVDKARKGRFIQVNQTTYLPNAIELIRTKKSSTQVDAQTNSSDGSSALIPDEKVRQSPANSVKLPPPIYLQKPYRRDDFIDPNNSSCADSLFEPQTFGYPSFFEDQFNARRGHQAYIEHPINCCNLDQLLGSFAGSLPCIDEYIVPQGNLFC